MTATTPNRFGIETGLGDPGLKYPTRHGRRETKLAQSIIYNKNVDDTFRQAPTVSNFGNAAGAVLPAEAAQGAVIGWHSGQAAYELFYSVVESTGTALYKVPFVSSAGLVMPVDADLTDGPTGTEIGLGTTARSRGAFVTGSEQGDFYCELTATVTTIANLKELWFGFRKAEAYAADCDNYTQVASINVGLGATGRFNITTILDDAATSTTNTTLTAWANAGTHTLRIIVRRATRAVEFWIDGVQSTVKLYTLNDALTVVPFLYVEGQTGDPVVAISSFKCGYL